MIEYFMEKVAMEKMAANLGNVAAGKNRISKTIRGSMKDKMGTTREYYINNMHRANKLDVPAAQRAARLGLGTSQVRKMRMYTPYVKDGKPFIPLTDEAAAKLLEEGKITIRGKGKKIGRSVDHNRKAYPAAVNRISDII